MTDEDDKAKLPIDMGEPTPTQSRQVLMLAVELGLLFNYHRPIDMALTSDVELVRAKLGPKATLPTDGGLYYLVVYQYADGRQQPVLIPEGDPRPMVFALGLAHSPEMARRVQYKLGMLPT